VVSPLSNYSFIPNTSLQEGRDFIVISIVVAMKDYQPAKYKREKNKREKNTEATDNQRKKNSKSRCSRGIPDKKANDLKN